VNYCGIDLGGVSSYAFVTDEKGNKLWSGPIATEKVAFEQLAKKFAGGGLSIAIEAGNQTAWVHEELVKLGAEVTVVNPTKVKLIAESRRKTDKIDAKILCELLRLNALPHPVHMPGPQARGCAACWWRDAVGVGPPKLSNVRGDARQRCVCRRAGSRRWSLERLLAGG
jgi:transposase